jgi:ubiquinone/menaquinone biosynthesis C-methylase UbiE
MRLYSKYVVPRAVDWACSSSSTEKQREKVVPQATGHVLEIGIGSGLNLPFYNPGKISSVTGLDPSIETWKRNKNDVDKLPFKFDYVQGAAEDLPFENGQFDTVLITYSMCTIPNLNMAFKEFARVLQPDGSLMFSEHGIAPDKSVLRWQNTLNPVWKRIGGGCNLNRNIPALIEANGFEIVEMDSMYIPGWKPASFHYWGRAVVRQGKSFR